LDPYLDVITNNFLEKGFSVSKDFLSAEEVNVALSRIDLLMKENAFSKAGIGNKQSFQQNEAIRNDFISWLEPEDELFKNMFFSKISELILHLNRHCYLGLNDFEFHLAHYGKGNYYKKHRDAFKTDDARKVSVVCYLNKNWKPEDGGELQLYLADETDVTIEPLAGQLVIFESRMEHEVLISNADRYSITGWLKNKSRLF
jgi:SM-20-related protein